MNTLNEIASILRSKNAGPLNVTFDIMFACKADYLRVRDSGVITAELVSKLYGVAPERVDIIPYDIVNSMKITIPRKIISGDLADTDIYGCQQQYPLSQVLIP